MMSTVVLVGVATRDTRAHMAALMEFLEVRDKHVCLDNDVAGQLAGDVDDLASSCSTARSSRR
jgi:hypothetical protein